MKKTKKPSAKSHTTKATKNLDVKPARGARVSGGLVPAVDHKIDYKGGL
jgi:hypothetical protein